MIINIIDDIINCDIDSFNKKILVTDYNINDLLISACYYGNFEIFKILAENYNADITTNNNYCIKTATIYNHFEIFKYLIDKHNVDLHIDDDYIIKKAKFLKKHNTEIYNYTMKILLKEDRENKLNQLL